MLTVHVRTPQPQAVQLQACVDACVYVVQTRRAALDEALQMELTEHAGDKARIAAASHALGRIVACLEEQHARSQAAVMQLASELAVARRCPDGLAAAAVLDAQLAAQQDHCSVLALVLHELQSQLFPFLAPSGPDSPMQLLSAQPGALAAAQHQTGVRSITPVCAGTSAAVCQAQEGYSPAAVSALETLAGALATAASRQRGQQQPCHVAGNRAHAQDGATHQPAGFAHAERQQRPLQSPLRKGQQPPGGVSTLRPAHISPGGAAGALTGLLSALQADASQLQQQLVLSAHHLRQQCRTPRKHGGAAQRRRHASPQHGGNSDDGECYSELPESQREQGNGTGSSCSPPNGQRVHDLAESRLQLRVVEHSTAASLSAMAAATLRKLQLLSQGL